MKFHDTGNASETVKAPKNRARSSGLDSGQWRRMEYCSVDEQLACSPIEKGGKVWRCALI